MAIQYTTVPETDLGAGIDQQSPENRIGPGYTENLINADPKAQGQLKTRKGYQGYAGNLPCRVIEVEQTGSDLCLTLDSSVDLAEVRGNPILVRGRTSDANVSNDGDFVQSTDSTHYYSTFTLDIKKTLSVGSGTLSIPQADHKFTTEYLAVQVTEATSLINTSNRHLQIGAVSINKTTKDITIDYDNNTGAAIEVYVQIDSMASELGVTYVSTGNTISTGSSTTTITAATHALNSFQILAWAFVDDGTSLVRFDTGSTTISPAGDVGFGIENDTGSTFDAVFILRAVSAANLVTGSVAANTTQSISIPNISTNFAYFAIYLEPTIGGTLEEVYAGDIAIDSETNTATVEFTNGTTSGKNFEVYYLPTSLVTNRLCVTADSAVTTPYEDLAPQMVIWGLPHSEIYGQDRTAREGWVSHIDSYRSAGENRLICGLGGTFYSAQLQAAYPTELPTYYPALNARVASDLVVGPVFWDTGTSPARTRGYIQASNAASGFVTVTSATYSSGTGRVTYRLSLPSKVVSGTLSTIISTTAGLRDQILIQQMGYSRLNGTFNIEAVTEGVDYLDVEVTNPRVSLSDFDETDAGGQAGIFTDQLPLTGSSPFLTADIVDSDLFTTRNVVSSSGSTVVIDGVIDEDSIPGGLRLVATRTSTVIPLRDVTGTAIIDNLVRGDMLSYTPVTRLIRILYVNSNADTSITITSDGTTATLTLGSGDTNNFSVGQDILILGSSNYNGVQTISNIPSTTTLEFLTSETASDSGTLIGKTINVDEELTVEDSITNQNSFSVPERWYPIEAPEDSFDLTPKTTVRTLDSNSYSQQQIIRSTMVQDNLYFTNGDDEVMKFDGQNIYRAGLFRWQPHLFVSTDSTATGAIVLNNQSVTVTGVSANIFTVALGDELAFVVGDQIRHSTDSTITYTITGISDDGTDGKITVNRTINGAGSGTIALIIEYKYYFRLNAVDANENIVASAIAGADDFVVQLTADAAVRIRLVGMPVLDRYDYDRLEVQIYRTKGNTIGPFYLITTLGMDFDAGGSYLDYLDTDSDEDLLRLDDVNSVLFGAELTGNGMSEPLRAEYITSAENRLVLSNIKDYPTLDIRLVPNSTGAITIPNLTASANRDFLFRRDSTDTGIATDMLNRATYTFIDNSGAVTLTPNTDITSPATDIVEIASPVHGLSVGDWVYLYHSAVADGNLLTFSGYHQITEVPTAGTFRFPLKGAAAGTTNDVDRYITAPTTTNIPVLLGVDGNYGMENGNRDISLIPSYEFLAMRRMANAINCSMRASNISDFSPWLIARAGNEFDSGQLIVKRPKVESVTPELQLGAIDGTFDLFVNDVRRAASSSAGALTRVFPSRTLISFPNFPEMFDRPTVQLDIDSQSAIDVNSADGQQITATIPFFGDSAFRGATKDSIVVVFKENSIYLLNVANKAAGAESIQKIESEGKGCTAPYSVAVTRRGIMFANFSGVYRLDRDLSITYAGQKVERTWQEELNKDQLSIATGHYFSNGNQYKLSYPSGVGQTENNQALVYNTVREYNNQSGIGSWTIYTQHSVVGWANLQDDSYFASTQGQVFSIRRANDNTDYRDDSLSIPVTILTRAMDFGNSGIRKSVRSVVTHYRTLVTTSNVSLKAGMDLINNRDLTDTFVIESNQADDNLSDTISRSVVSIKSSLVDSIGNYLQLEYTINQKDEPIEISGIAMRVGAKSSEGLTEAADT